MFSTMNKNRSTLILFLVLSIIIHATLFTGIGQMAWIQIHTPLPIGVFLPQEAPEEKGRIALSSSVISAKKVPPSKPADRPPPEAKPSYMAKEEPPPKDIPGKIGEPGEGAEAVNGLTLPKKELNAPDRTPPRKTASLMGDEIRSLGKPDAPVEIAGPRREKLTFNIYWMGIYVGRATLEAVKDGDKVVITSNVRSNAVISSFYKVDDNAESMLVNNRAVNFKLHQSEGKHRRERETIFDLANGKVIFLNHLNKTREEHNSGGKALWDVISAFYYLRTQPMQVGKTIYIDMFDSNKFLKTQVKVLRKERLKLFDNREADTVVVEPVLDSEGLFQKSGEILIWLTDDKNRAPVRMETSVKIGKVTAELKASEVEP